MARLFVLYLCSLLLRSLVVGALAGLTAGALRNVAWRHAVWTTALGCILLMPVADVLLPRLMTPPALPEVVTLPIQTFVIVPVEGLLPPEPQTPQAVLVMKSSVDVWRVVALGVVFIAAGLLSRQLWALAQIFRLRKRSRRIEDYLLPADETGRSLRAQVFESNAVVTPLTIGFLKPALILPRNWPSWDAWKLRAVLVHELTHVRRSDWAIAVVAAFARCAFWFNPAVWWIERRLSVLAERACDEASVHKLGDAPRYAETLLEFASTVQHGHRWIGGVAMAQHRISKRIHWVLAAKRPGSGTLSAAGWAVLAALVAPALFLSAAGPAAIQAETPKLSAAEIRGAVQARLPEAESVEVAAMAQQPVPAVPAPQAPATQAPAQGAPLNPDLVGEIRLILAPVEQQLAAGQGQGADGVRLIGVGSLFRALPPSFWDRNAAFLFSLTRVQGRTVSFQRSDGGDFSYACPDCTFQVGEFGVTNPGIAEPGVVFRLSADGATMTATCRARECRVGTNSQLAANPPDGRFPGTSFVTLGDGQSLSFGVLQSTANPVGRICFSVFGAVKADGSPFTAADCPDGRISLPEAVLFAVTR